MGTTARISGWSCQSEPPHCVSHTTLAVGHLVFQWNHQLHVQLAWLLKKLITLFILIKGFLGLSRIHRGFKKKKEREEKTSRVINSLSFCSFKETESQRINGESLNREWILGEFRIPVLYRICLFISAFHFSFLLLFWMGPPSSWKQQYQNQPNKTLLFAYFPMKYFHLLDKWRKLMPRLCCYTCTRIYEDHLAQ